MSLFLLLFFHHLQFETVFFIVSIVYNFVVENLEKSKNNESGPYVEKVAEFKISGRVLKNVGLSSEWVSREGTTIIEYINFLHCYLLGLYCVPETLESLRVCSLKHTSSAWELLSVISIAIRFRVLT